MQYNSKYEKILIQYRQIHREWNPLSETSTETTAVGDINKVKVNHLNIGCSYEFRGLFENDNDEIVQLTSKKSIKIKSILFCKLLATKQLNNDRQNSLLLSFYFRSGS